MRPADDIRRITEETMTALQAPDGARSEPVARVRLTDGLSCEVREGDWTFHADVPEDSGGRDRGPSPSALMRGAIGACFAMDCAIWAAMEGVPIDDVEVEVRTVLDPRGMFGLADVPRGFQSVSITARIRSRAPRADVERVLGRARRLNPRLHEMSVAVPVETHLELLPPSGADSLRASGTGRAS